MGRVFFYCFEGYRGTGLKELAVRVESEGDLIAARIHWELLLQHDPNDVNALSSLARLVENSDPACAARCLRRAIALEPNNEEFPQRLQKVLP